MSGNGPYVEPHEDSPQMSAIVQVEAKQDKVVFIFNFFDELRRIAPVKK